MNNTTKTILRVCFGALLLASLTVWAVRSFRSVATPPAPTAANAPTTAAEPTAPTTPTTGQLLADGVAVINFHGEKR